MRSRRRSRGESTEFADRLIGGLSYIINILIIAINGMLGFIWLFILVILINSVIKKPFLRFNIYQSLLLGILLLLVSMVGSFIYGLLMYIPIIKDIVGTLVFYLLQYQMILGIFSIAGFAITLYVFYLAISAFQGKTPEVPWISRNVRQLM